MQIIFLHKSTRKKKSAYQEICLVQCHSSTQRSAIEIFRKLFLFRIRFLCCLLWGMLATGEQAEMKGINPLCSGTPPLPQHAMRLLSFQKWRMWSRRYSWLLSHIKDTTTAIEYGSWISCIFNYLRNIFHTLQAVLGFI